MKPRTHPASFPLAVLTLLGACSVSLGQLREPAAPEAIAYLAEDFETFTPWVWCQQPQARGQASGETGTVHAGKRAVALEWDFRKSPPEYCFANFMVGRRLLGQVQQVRIWLHATANEVGAPLALWLQDRTGEVYIQRARVQREGWEQVSFPIAGLAPGWSSGDGNGQQDLPLSLFGLAVEFGGPPAGRLVVDNLEVVTQATPRQALDLSLYTDQDKNLFWDVRPLLQLRLRNHATGRVMGVRCDLAVEDLYREHTVTTATVLFGDVAGTADLQRTEALDLPYGVFRVHWKLADGDGELLGGSLDLCRMMPPCYRDAPDSVRAYERRWGLFGGVFGSITPQLASDMGARWVRYENTVWSDYETNPGRFDMASLRRAMLPYKQAGIESIVLQTLYQRPSFRNPDQLDFAPAYGEAMRQTALAARDLAHCFELGNEDNGPTKLLYTEVARHGAAGIRSVQPQALIANSGTAFIDLEWLRMQAARGLCDWLDVLCTHPYTVNDPPESWNILERFGQVDELIDNLGGMKTQWTTEFGWHHEFSQPRRAEWIPRHYLIAAAAGIERHGLYTWERDYGVFQGTAQPPAASLHALAKMIEGHRFVGLLSQDDQVWACVFERAGTPLVVAWSPAGRAQWSVPARLDAQAYDLFGNLLPVSVRDGSLAVPLEAGPTYVTGATDAVLDTAAHNESVRQRARFVRCVQAANLPKSSVWERLAALPQVAPDGLGAALLAWSAERGPINASEQAIVAAALRWYRCLPIMTMPVGRTPQRELDAARAALRERLAELIAQDTDVPALRYLLERWDRLADETLLCQDLGSESLAAHLRAMQETVKAVCERFLRDGERVLWSLWPYLHAPAADGSLQETLQFVPGDSSTIHVRVNSYSPRERTVSVSLRLPPGWHCEPEVLSLLVRPGVGAQGELRVRCPLEATPQKPTLACILRSEGLPERTVPFDDVSIEAPVQIRLSPVAGLLPGTPLHLELSNRSAAPVSGLLRLMRAGDSRALARARFTDLVAGAPRHLELTLRPTAPFTYHEWPLVAQFILEDGRCIERELSVDFACAVRAAAPPVVDGDLGEWISATPLHLDRAEYDKGSFGGRWAPEDLSATTYLMWDNEALYFAARVTDQTFKQALSGTSQWMQDSIQFALARDERSPRTEIGLALTPGGEEVVSYTAATPDVPGARLRVRVHQGGAVYEAAVPWTAFSGLGPPAAGRTLRYSVLVNDDDAVTGRRFLERYGGIAHDKDVGNFGFLTLLGETGAGTTEPPTTPPVLLEDFEEYEDGTLPDAWLSVTHEPPVPECRVQTGAGRDGSSGLVMTNAVGLRPYVYRNLVRPLPMVRPGQSYVLRCWMRGRGVEATGGIIGVCSDIWGNEGFTYLEHGAVTEEWKQVTLRFTGPPGGRLNLIIRNATRMEELAIDDIEIVCQGDA